MDWHGTFITCQTWDKEARYGKRINGHRGEIHEMVFNYAKARGIDIRLGRNVTDYFETGDEAGALANGVETGGRRFCREGVRSLREKDRARV